MSNHRRLSIQFTDEQDEALKKHLKDHPETKHLMVVIREALALYVKDFPNNMRPQGKRRNEQ